MFENFLWKSSAIVKSTNSRSIKIFVFTNFSSKFFCTNLSNVKLEILQPFSKQPPEVFYRKAVPTNFTIFTRKHLSLIKLWAFWSATLLKGDSNKDFFLRISRNFKEHLFWRTSVNPCFCIFEKRFRRTLVRTLIFLFIHLTSHSDCFHIIAEATFDETKMIIV